MEIRLSLASADTAADVVVDTAPEVPVAVLAAEFGRQVGAHEPGGVSPELYVAGHRLDGATTVADSPLRDGVVVGVGGPDRTMPPNAQGTTEIHVTGGPDAGGVFRLGPSTAVIGSGPQAWVRVADPALPPAAAEVDVAVDGTVVVGPAPLVAEGAESAELRLDGELLDAPREWPLRGVLTCGHTAFERAVPGFPDGALRPAEDGAGLDYNRPPRVLPLPRRRKFQIPTRPEQGEAQPLPWLMMLGPLVGALVMAYIMKTPRFLILAVLSPLSMVGMFFANKRHGRRSFRSRLARYHQRKASIEEQVAHAMGLEALQRRSASPDAAKIGLIATGPRRRLWERRAADADRLVLRVATGELPSEVEVMDPRREEHRRADPRRVHDVPVTVSLPDSGVLGVAGRANLPRAVARWLVAQAAVLHSPADLRVYVLTDHAGGPDWEWVRWLPHARPDHEGQAVALIGTDAESVGRRIAELLGVLTSRQDAMKASGAADMQAGPDHLIVFDGSRRLRTVPGVTQLLRDGPAVGMYAVCLDADRSLLPQECGAVVEEDWYGLLNVTRTGADTVDGARPDAVSAAWCEGVARALAPLRDARIEEAAGLPDASRLLDVLELEPPTADLIAGRWSLGGRSTMAVVGESFDGAFGVDLVRDGPHGLVAGTTGSGKSELLQTIVASLAVANRPDEMTFALVDFKGGAAFKDCARLPHTVGMVTDLEARLVERALESLAAELRRREHILADADTKDLEDYHVAMRRDPSLGPVPRLLIVIDEFAEMVSQMGDYVTALVNIARRGRSLGIHLILATQRPSGAVSPEIRANTNLRIALRVTDSAESADVIDAPDAGRISKTTPGRAYVRLGASSLLPFQSARVGGRRPGAADDAAPPPPRVVELPWSALGSPVPPPPRGPRTESDDLLTDLAVLVDAIAEANDRLGIPPQHSPWAPPLPDVLTLGELIADAPESAPDTLVPAPYALEDLPSEQSRRVRTVDLTTFGHLIAAGAPRTGRSQLLRTIAGALATTNSCADVHLYALDCGNGALMPLESLPHCGAVVRASDSERAVRLLEKLAEEVRTRMAMLGERGFTDVGEQRAHAPADERLPHIVLLLDRWEGFTNTVGDLNHGEHIDTILQLMREGASAGVHVIASGDRTLLTGRISQLTENRMAFQLSDKGDYGLVGLMSRQAPDELTPGRAYRVGAVELHVAMLAADPAGQAQAAALRSIAETARVRDADVPRARRPFGVDVLPSRIEYAAAWALRGRGGTPASAGPLWGMVAVGGDTLSALGPDLGTGTPAFVIAGPAQSGRSTALAAMAKAYLAVGTELIVLAPRESPLRGLRGVPGVMAVFEQPDVPEAEFAAAVDKLSGPGVVLVDDAELLRDCEAGPELTRIARRSLRPEVGLILAGDADSVCVGFSGWQVEAKKARRGLLLSPQNTMDGDLIGVRLPRAFVGHPVQPGRGVLHLGDGDQVVVQVPATTVTG